MRSACSIVMARGGSKRIPRKNARSFCGLPMVAWPVTHAVKSGLFSEVVISTDDEEIASVACEHGASFYGLRPAALSNDFAITPAVLQYELKEIEKRTGTMPKVCCCLYGTSIFASPERLHLACEALKKQDCDFVMAVLEYSHPIERALQFDKAGHLVYRQPEFMSRRTQDIVPSYYDTGMLYVFNVETFFEQKCTFLQMRRRAIIVCSNEAVDIDNESDWVLAEQLAIMQNLLK